VWFFNNFCVDCVFTKSICAIHDPECGHEARLICGVSLSSLCVHWFLWLGLVSGDFMWVVPERDYGEHRPSFSHRLCIRNTLIGFRVANNFNSTKRLTISNSKTLQSIGFRGGRRKPVVQQKVFFSSEKPSFSPPPFFWGEREIQAVSKGLCFLGVRGRGGHR